MNSVSLARARCVQACALAVLGVAAAQAFRRVALKVADGSLRYSLHRRRPSSCVCRSGRRAHASKHVDLSRNARASLGLPRDSAGRAFTPSPRCGAWAGGLAMAGWGARSHFRSDIALFRARLRSSRATTWRFPSSTSLARDMLRLGSDKRSRVWRPWRLEREHKTPLVPALLLHHPSEAVVLRVLAILTASGRKTAVRTITRIADHASARVRAAALAARSVLEPDPRQLRLILEQESLPEVRATLVVNLIVAGAYGDAEREQHIEALLRDGSVATRLAFAEAIGRRSALEFDRVLARLLCAPEIEVRRAALVAASSVTSL